MAFDLKEQTNFLFAILESSYEKNKDTMSSEELREHLMYVVNSARYGKSGYFWINDSNPTMIMHPIKPALNGKDLSGFKDANGVYLFNDMAKVVKESG